MQATHVLATELHDHRPCESDQGDWGGICPVCGQQLPPRPAPLQSWHAGRAIDRLRSQQARDSSRQASLRHWHL
jgi:hypothetical protein